MFAFQLMNYHHVSFFVMLPQANNSLQPCCTWHLPLLSSKLPVHLLKTNEIAETLVWRVLISLLQRPPTHPRNGHSNQHFQGDTITNHAPPRPKRGRTEKQKQRTMVGRSLEPPWR